MFSSAGFLTKDSWQMLKSDLSEYHDFMGVFIQHCSNSYKTEQQELFLQNPARLHFYTDVHERALFPIK